MTQETLQRCGQENHLGFVQKDYGKRWATQQSNSLSSSFLLKNAILVKKTHFQTYPNFEQLVGHGETVFLRLGSDKGTKSIGLGVGYLKFRPTNMFRIAVG